MNSDHLDTIGFIFSAPPPPILDRSRILNRQLEAYDPYTAAGHKTLGKLISPP